jgi:hypothetical protein
MERYPSDLVVTEQDFADSGWVEALSEAKREGYSSMWQAFSSAATKAMDEGRQAHGKVLWLLADACSMTLSPKSANEPFKPFWVAGGERSIIPDDLSESDIAFFSQIMDVVDDPWLKARIADLVWLKQRPREARFALAAIDSYRSLSLAGEVWIRDGQRCWERAIGLALMLRDGAGDRVEEMEAAIVAAFEAAGRAGGFFAMWLADLLEVNRLGRGQELKIAQRLEFLARDFEEEGELHRARLYFDAAARWYKRAGDGAKCAEMTKNLAEGWVKEAIARTSTEQPSYMVAASFYENAIQIYRTIPRPERSINRVDERIDELRVHLSECGEKSLGEMGVIRSPGVNISGMVQSSRKAVRGKNATEALKAFANLYGGVNVKEMREATIERIREFPLQSLFPATIMSPDGRVIAKRPGMGLGNALTGEDEVAIRSDMIRDYGIEIGLVVQGNIWPALEELLVEHRLTESDFTNLARQSPIVPKGREHLFGKALFAGYDRDFVAALHVLVPQVENLVRHHLKAVGAKTTTLSLDGIENEIGLSALMELPEVQQVFGENLAFEIRALFCDAFGPNLRNELAHGLLDDEACYSIHSIYAWWFALRLIFTTYWNAARKKTQSGEMST